MTQKHRTISKQPQGCNYSSWVGGA